MAVLSRATSPKGGVRSRNGLIPDGTPHAEPQRAEGEHEAAHPHALHRAEMLRIGLVAIAAAAVW